MEKLKSHHRNKFLLQVLQNYYQSVYLIICFRLEIKIYYRSFYSKTQYLLFDTYTKEILFWHIGRKFCNSTCCLGFHFHPCPVFFFMLASQWKLTLYHFRKAYICIYKQEIFMQQSVLSLIFFQ